MPKDVRKEAEKLLAEAERLLEHEKFKKAGKEFRQAGDMFFELADYNVAEQCYFYAAKAFLGADKLSDAAEVQRSAANACILLNDYKKAEKYYQVAAKYFLRAEMFFEGILNGSFAYLCIFVQGKQDRGLEYIKQVKQNVPFDDFKENQLVQLVRSLTLSIVDHNREELLKIEQTVPQIKMRNPELSIIQRAIILARVYLALGFELQFTKTKYITDEIIEFKCLVDTTQLASINVPPILKLSVKEITVKEVEVVLSENFAVKRKPVTPFPIIGPERKILEFQLRANYPLEKSFVGPVILTYVIGDVVFSAKSPTKSLVVTSPPARIGIFMKPEGSPLINKTFPMDITLTNESDGEATNIELEITFPPNLQLMRGLPKKTIYSIAAHERVSFQVMLQPTEAGETPVKVTMSFKDADGNVNGPQTAELPFEIKL
ncbi:MAG: hypothetical protein RBG13Loki_2588 [Promethearchaeota archaeon CR_4]|nr:MAG: hypothetical protein RBG13Loki_2588 [Candidatus Lokiarchaeota archaeon CR_4]